MSENYSVIYRRLSESSDDLQDAVADAVSLDQTNLVKECYRQAATAMTWAYMASLAAEESAKLKFRLEEVVGPRLRTEARNAAPVGKKVTAQEASDYAAGQQEYQDLALAVIEAQARADMLRKVEYALIQKKDMIQTINSRQRAELRGDPNADIERVRDR